MFKHGGIAILCLQILTAGCAQTQTIRNYQLTSAERTDQERREAAAARLEDIKAASLPKDYRAKIDSRFASILKDPDSRKIIYEDPKFGSLVCGLVNAKNSYGGYTGNKIFISYFSKLGALDKLQILPDDVVVMNRSYDSSYTLEYRLLDICSAPT
jgi:hypothetical protein